MAALSTFPTAFSGVLTRQAQTRSTLTLRPSRSCCVASSLLSGSGRSGGSEVVGDPGTAAATSVSQMVGGQITVVTLSADYASGTVGASFSDPSFASPTTIERFDGCLLVVNSQFAAFQGQPQLPFAVSSVPIPISGAGAATPFSRRLLPAQCADIAKVQSGARAVHHGADVGPLVEGAGQRHRAEPLANVAFGRAGRRGELVGGHRS